MNSMKHERSCKILYISNMILLGLILMDHIFCKCFSSYSIGFSLHRKIKCVPRDEAKVSISWLQSILVG